MTTMNKSRDIGATIRMVLFFTVLVLSLVALPVGALFVFGWRAGIPPAEVAAHLWNAFGTLMSIGVGIALFYLAPHLRRKPPAPVAPIFKSPVTRLALVAPGQHKPITFEEAITLLEANVHAAAYAADLEAKLRASEIAREQAETALSQHDSDLQAAIDKATDAVRLQYQAEVEDLARRHARAFKNIETQRDNALREVAALREVTAAPIGKPTRDEVLTFLRLALDDKLTRAACRAVAPMPGDKYQDFVAAVRDIVQSLPKATPSPAKLIHPAFVDLHPNYVADLSFDDSGGAKADGRTGSSAPDQPTDSPAPTPGPSLAIVLYDRDFARTQGGEV